MRLPRITYPLPVLLFLAGAFVGSFLTLNLTTRGARAAPPRGAVQGESTATEPSARASETEMHEASPAPMAVPPPARDGSVRVARVIDGDTIELEGGARIRYIGINAPETSSTGRDECLAVAAKAANASLVEGKRVALVSDVSDLDRYGRGLRYVYAGGMFVNAALIEQGLAKATAYPPDTVHQEEFAHAEERARTGKFGMWGTVCAAVPDATRETRVSPAGRRTLPGTCEIKGNISTVGDKIYHLPVCRSYGKTVINTQEGERWFCSEQEARDAGWRKAKDC